MAVDSALTPPLSLEETKAKKIAKKARKEARRAAAAVDQTEEVELPGKRKVDEEGEEEEGKKQKKSKKNKQLPIESTLDSLVSVVISSTAVECAEFLLKNNISHEPLEAKEVYAPLLKFEELAIEAGIRKGLGGYEKPTPIQSASFPVMLGGRDVIGIAETGYVFPPPASPAGLTKGDQ